MKSVPAIQDHIASGPSIAGKGAWADGSRHKVRAGVAIRADPQFSLAFFNRGQEHKDRGDPDRAIADYTAAIGINPKSDVAYMRRSEAWLKKEDKLAALRDADEAVNLDPNDPANYANRATVMRALSRNDDAVTDLRKGLSLNPNEGRKRQLEGALRELGAAP